MLYLKRPLLTFQGDVLLELRGRRADPADQQVLRSEGGEPGAVHRQDRGRQVSQGKYIMQ